MEHLVNLYGVKVSSYLDERFMKYLDNSGIAVNTLKPEERTTVVLKWLSDNKLNEQNE